MNSTADGTFTRFRNRPKVKRTLEVGREVVTDLKRDDVPGLGAEIAYHAIFAIPPLIILIVTIAAAINQFTGYELASRLTQVIEERAPDEIRELLLTLVDHAIANVNGGLASLGVLTALILAIWSGSNGVSALIKAFNRAYGVTEDRSFLKLKSLSIGLTVLVAVLVNSAFFLLVFGDQVAQWAENRFGLGHSVTLVITYLRAPLAFIFVVLVLALLYYVGPNVKQSYRWLSPGSIVATILWAIAAFGFQFYLRFADPGSAYGALGSIVVFMFFLYVSGIICVLGAEVNAILGERFDPETIEDLAEHPMKLSDPDDRPEVIERDRKMRHPKSSDPQVGRPEEPETSRASTIASRAVAPAIFVGIVIAGIVRRQNRGQ